MRAQLEPEDLQAIAGKIMEILSPVLTRPGKIEEDTIFDVQGLADYLKVDISWVYKAVQMHQVPFFKAGKYTRFRKSAIDKHIEKSMVQPASPARIPGGRT